MISCAIAITGALSTPVAFTEIWQLSICVVLIGAFGCITGALLGLATVREASLFRYVKE